MNSTWIKIIGVLVAAAVIAMLFLCFWSKAPPPQGENDNTRDGRQPAEKQEPQNAKQRALQRIGKMLGNDEIVSSETDIEYELPFLGQQSCKGWKVNYPTRFGGDNHAPERTFSVYFNLEGDFLRAELLAAEGFEKASSLHLEELMKNAKEKVIAHPIPGADVDFSKVLNYLRNYSIKDAKGVEIVSVKYKLVDNREVDILVTYLWGVDLMVNGLPEKNIRVLLDCDGTLWLFDNLL